MEFRGIWYSKVRYTMWNSGIPHPRWGPGSTATPPNSRQRLDAWSPNLSNKITPNSLFPSRSAKPSAMNLLNLFNPSPSLANNEYSAWLGSPKLNVHSLGVSYRPFGCSSFLKLIHSLRVGRRLAIGERRIIIYEHISYSSNIQTWPLRGSPLAPPNANGGTGWPWPYMFVADSPSMTWTVLIRVFSRLFLVSNHE